jgi:colicin import membrane protein
MPALLPFKPRLRRPEDPFHIGYRYVPVTQPDGSVRHTQQPLTEEDFLHPQEEDRFLVNNFHSGAINYLRNALQTHARGKPGMRVFSEHRIDWQQPPIKAHAPDIVVFLNFNVKWNDFTGTVRVRDVGALVVEVTSPSTRHLDLENKLEEYHLVGVPNYLIIDIFEDEFGYHANPLQMYRNTPEGFVTARKSASGMYGVPELGVAFQVVEDRLEVFDSQGLRLMDHKEAIDAIASERLRAETEARRADALTAELAALKAKLTTPSTNGH